MASCPGFPSVTLVCAKAACCKLLCLPSRPVPRRYDAHQGYRKAFDKRKELGNQRLSPTYPSAGAMKDGVGRIRGCSSAPSPSAATLRSSPFSSAPGVPSDASLCTSLLAGAGTSLPTSVVERKSSASWLHLVPGRRASPIVNRLLHLLVSFRT